MVHMPLEIHASKIKDADGKASAINPVVINIPEPITMPITIIELSNNPSWRLSFTEWSFLFI